jgi:hypothetical protein
MTATEPRLAAPEPTAIRGRWRFPWELSLALAVQFLMIVPILRSAWEFDDQINSTTKGALHLTHMGWWDFSTNIVRGWIDGPGRWFPLGFYWGYAQSDLFTNLLLYKWLLVVYALLACVFVFALMRELGLGRGPSALVVVVMAVATQVRLYPDPHMAYGGLTQVVTILLASAMIAYQRWLKGGPWLYLAACLFLTAVAASTYEAVYLCAPLFVIQAIRERTGLKAIARASAGPVLLMLGFIALGAYLRSHGTDGANGPYAPGFALGELVDTFVDQFVGAVPLTYAHFNPQHVFDVTRLLHAEVYDVVVGCVAGIVTWALLSRARWDRAERWSPLETTAIGIAFWVIVAGSLALAKRYQAEIVIGLAHVPVYFEEVALAITAVSVAGFVSQRLAPGFRARFRGVFAVGGGVLVGLVAMLQHHSNDVVITATEPARELRNLDDHALAAGLFDRLHDGSVLYANGQPWRQNTYYWMHSHRTLVVRYLEGVAAGATPKPGRICALDSPTGDAVSTVYQSPTDITSGIASLGCAYPGHPSAVYLRNIDPAAGWISGQRFDGTPFVGHPKDLLRPIGRGLWTVREPDMDVRQLVIAADPATPTLAAASTGCGPDEGGGQRWCDRRGTLYFLGRPGARLTMTMPVIVAAAKSHLTFDTAGVHRRAKAVMGSNVTLPLQLDSHGAAQVRYVYDGPRYRAPNDPRTLYFRIVTPALTPR